jgi:hypothetical protein
MTKKLGWRVAVCVAAAGLWAGTALAEKPQAPTGQPNMEELAKAMQAMMSAGTNAAALVDFRELKALLPAMLPKMKRTKASGEKSGAMGMAVAMAEGDYEGEGENGGTVHIKITDMGGLGGMAMFAQAAWLQADVDRESDDGYEKTVKYGDFKALEKYNTPNKDGEIQIMVANRFMVEISGSDVDMAVLKDAVAKIDLKKRSTLKAAAPEAPKAP